MAAHQNFRSAFNGFNREDVVRYIEYLNTTHAAEIAQLNSELEYLRSRELPAAESDIPAEEVTEAEEKELREKLVAGIDSGKDAEAAQELEALKQDLEEKVLEIELLKTELEEKSAEIERLKADAEEKTAEIEQLKAEAESTAAQIENLKADAEAKHAEMQALNHQNEQLRSQQEANAGLVEKELETYRRAERVERKAKERADLVYYRVNGTLSDATGKVEDAAKLIGEMTERVTAQLNELQAAVTGSKQALTDAAETMSALRPAAEEE